MSEPAETAPKTTEARQERLLAEAMRLTGQVLDWTAARRFSAAEMDAMAARSVELLAEVKVLRAQLGLPPLLMHTSGKRRRTRRIR